MWHLRTYADVVYPALVLILHEIKLVLRIVFGDIQTNEQHTRPPCDRQL